MMSIVSILLYGVVVILVAGGLYLWNVSLAFSLAITWDSMLTSRLRKILSTILIVAAIIAGSMSIWYGGKYVLAFIRTLG